MATKAEQAQADSERKGLRPERTRKLARRKTPQERHLHHAQGSKLAEKETNYFRPEPWGLSPSKTPY